MSTHQRKPKTVAKKQRRDEARQRRAKQARAQARRQRAVRIAAIAAVTAVVGGGFVALLLDSRMAGAPEGVVNINETSRNHVTGEVAYTNQPPAGGDHAGVWQNCGYYDQPVPNETAVHSLEHGAVWIQYSNDLDGPAKNRLRQVTDREPFVLASPLTDLESPVVLSAWGNSCASTASTIHASTNSSKRSFKAPRHLNRVPPAPAAPTNRHGKPTEAGIA